jgi:hypothetical protein
MPPTIEAQLLIIVHCLMPIIIKTLYKALADLRRNPRSSTTQCSIITWHRLTASTRSRPNSSSKHAAAPMKPLRLWLARQVSYRRLTILRNCRPLITRNWIIEGSSSHWTCLCNFLTAPLASRKTPTSWTPIAHLPLPGNLRASQSLRNLSSST